MEPFALEEFSDFTRPARTLCQHERIIIAGQGEVAQAARSVIADEKIDVVTIDIKDREGVDIVGEAGSEDVLQEAGIETAGAIIIGLPDDSASLLTTVLARSLNSNIEILVRVSDTDATRKALSAGADYVLSVPRVSARMVAKEFRGEEVLAPASQIRLIRVPADPLAGSTFDKSGIYEQTGCRVIAVEDDTGLTSTIDPNGDSLATNELRLLDPTRQSSGFSSDSTFRRWTRNRGVMPMIDSDPLRVEYTSITELTASGGHS